MKFFSTTLNQTYELTFVEQHKGLVNIVPQIIQIQANRNSYKVAVVGVNPGSVMITGQLTPNGTIRYIQFFV